MHESQKVEINVSLARNLYREFAATLFKEPGFIALLSRYAAEIEKSSNVMEEIGLPNICSFCATKIPGGGCCGSSVATWYDPLLLFINLMMDVGLQDDGYYEGCCRFLGRDGCTLKARYHFCVNYLCKRIYDAFDQKAIDLLRAQSGAELFAGWELEVFTRQFFLKQGITL